ncbi:MAG TPA: Glu/Leu/Phe/Val dehydrogenase dimerization domain-containing protein [Actinomycetota bacterium]|nr:Glu/Leu/Phe/Val dehydrogenase dimerization domain-containing protein [Actinomycetota bacterium]
MGVGGGFEELLRGWDGEFVALRHDGPTATWMFVGVHSTALGPAFGGTRMKVYPAPADALWDVLRLAQAMTLKNALAGIPFGGGKAVLAVPEVPRGEPRRELLLRYADLVASLGGTYVTAADMNTGAPDMDVIGERTEHVLGRSPARGGSGEPSPATARGVFHGIRAAALHAFGSEDLSGRSVLVQGVGAVGGRLADLLAEAGAKVLVSDLDPERARAAALRVDGVEVAAAEAIGAECDVFSPCATGGVLSAATIPRLRCRVVAGAANNQLLEPADAERLRDAGILYAPDFVVNAGGVLSLAGLEVLGWTEAELEERLRGIGDTLLRVFALAEAEGITTDAAARRLAEDRIAAARRGTEPPRGGASPGPG